MNYYKITGDLVIIQQLLEKHWEHQTYSHTGGKTRADTIEVIGFPYAWLYVLYENSFKDSTLMLKSFLRAR
jgi:hypothetical protein